MVLGQENIEHLICYTKITKPPANPGLKKTYELIPTSVIPFRFSPGASVTAGRRIPFFFFPSLLWQTEDEEGENKQQQFVLSLS